MIANFVRELGEMECDDEEDELFLGMALISMGEQVEKHFFGAWPPAKGLPDESLFRLLDEIGGRESEAGSGDTDAESD